MYVLVMMIFGFLSLWRNCSIFSLADGAFFFLDDIHDLALIIQP